MPELSEPLISFWYRALSSPIGIELTVSDPGQVKQKLYATRREAKDLDLDRVSICESPFDPNKLWLVKRAEGNGNGKTS